MLFRSLSLRQRRDIVLGNDRLSLNQLLDRAKIEWHGVALGQPDWSERSHSLAFTLRTLHSRFDLHVAHPVRTRGRRRCARSLRTLGRTSELL